MEMRTDAMPIVTSHLGVMSNERKGGIWLEPRSRTHAAATVNQKP